MISPDSSKTKLTQRDIKALFARAKRVLRLPGLDILLASAIPTTLSTGHLVVVTPRVIGNAPARNKVRRRLKAIFHEQQLFTKPYSCIVIVKKGGVLLSFADLKDALARAYDIFNKEKSHAG